MRMTHVQLDIPASMVRKLRKNAAARGLSLARYVTELVRRDVTHAWPDRFFDEVVGGWKGKPLRRPPQGALETRDEL
jgi:hypothetical protein